MLGVQRLIDASEIDAARKDGLIYAEGERALPPQPCPLVCREAESFCVAFFPVWTSKKKNRFHLFALAVLFLPSSLHLPVFKAGPETALKSFFPSFPERSALLFTQWDPVIAAALQLCCTSPAAFLPSQLRHVLHKPVSTGLPGTPQLVANDC